MYKSMLRSLALLFLLSIVLVGCTSQQTQSSTPSTQGGSSGTTPLSSKIDDNPIQSKGCGLNSTIHPGQSTIESIVSGGITRTYLLHIPTGYKDTVRQPLVLNFHGHGSTSWRQAAASDFSQLANQDDFIVAYPQGAVGPDRQTGWATGPTRNPHVNDVLFVSDLLNKLQSTLCINPERIYATGFSNGGGMTYVLACKMADRFAAFAPVSGSYPTVPGGCTPARPVPLLEFHGTGDTVVPYNGSIRKAYPPVHQWLLSWVQHDGCALSPTITHPGTDVTEYIWQKCRDGSVLEHYKLLGWPHAWPIIGVPKRTLPSRNSKAQKNSPPVMGSVNATPIIWSFFQSHPLVQNA